MTPTRLYLDTSVINFLFADDAPRRRDVTLAFFERLRRDTGLRAYASYVVEQEIANTTNEAQRRRLLEALTSNPITLLELDGLDERISELAEAYVAEGILTPKYRDDALHVAIATIAGMDVLLSWNFKHLVNDRREAGFIAVNQRMGFPLTPSLQTPEFYANG